MRKRGFLPALGLSIFVGMLFFCTVGITVRAEESDFVIDATKLPSDEETYNVQVSIENLGADWEGTARLTVYMDYRYPGIYDTMISLPQGSAKQFVVRVPIDTVGDTEGTISISLWDKKSNKAASKEFKRFLSEGADALAMGILSDDYSALTYLDLGGQELYYYGSDYPIKLTELSQGNIVDSLETLDFLVIDTYNTGILTDEELKAIELWNYEGGVLFVGTGNYAEDTLKGLEDYLGINCLKVYNPEEIPQYIYADHVDLSQLHMAELQDVDGRYDEPYFSDALCSSIGEGAIGIFPYALTEIASVNESFYLSVIREDFVLNIMEEVSSYANARYNYTSYSNDYNNNYTLGRLMRVIGNVNSPLNFTVLNILVILYVIFVGPVLYFILRFMKKRDFYWVTVPVTALVGVVLIFFAGRGFEVVNAKVYSVSVENLSGKDDSKTYLYCYDAGHKEWDLKLNEGYEYVGAIMNDTYIYDADEDDYYHHIKQEGNTLSFGIKPTSNFEDSYFYAGKSREDNGADESIVIEGITSGLSGVSGTVTNGTEHDFIYYAVVTNDTLYVYENLPAGETSSLGQQIPVYNSYQGYDMWSNYVYDFLMGIYDEEPEKADMVSALGVGLCSAYPRTDLDATVVIGVTEEWDKAVDDDCNEVSYGCLYIVQ